MDRLFIKMARLSPIINLYKMTPDGRCTCHRKAGCEDAGKHPARESWRQAERYPDEIYEELESLYKESYGVVLQGLLVVDVDYRNQGAASLVKLMEAIPELSDCGFIVATGSGDGSQHLYYRIPSGLALKEHAEGFPGIDFKSSGFVVGPNSRHASGGRYTVHRGGPESVTTAPAALIELLKRPHVHRTTVNGQTTDISDEQIEDMLRYINADCEYDAWVRIGMAIHAATSGQGFSLWLHWSETGEKFPGKRELQAKWRSFHNRGEGGVSAGTLYHYAREAGWVEPVSFESGDTVNFQQPQSQNGFVNLYHPPGFVGKITRWINDNCLYPRETLAVAAALHAIGAICALRYTDDYKVRTNLMTIGIASSGSGKNAVIEAVGKLLHAAGLAPATYGRIKSERDLLNTLLAHQCAHYYMDELGEQLKKALGTNVATHNIGLVGTIMEVMTKANGYMPIEGAEKARIKGELRQRMAFIKKAIEENEDEDGRLKDRELPRIKRALEQIEYGIEKPVFSLIGVASPVSIAGGLDRDMAENGFIRRSLIAWEHEPNPRAKPGFTPSSDVPLMMAENLLRLGGSREWGDPIEHREELIRIPTDPDAIERLAEIQNEVWELAEEQKVRSGLVAIQREVYHNTLKLSLILAIPGGARTLEMVDWAYAYAKRNAEETMMLVVSNDKDQDALLSKIMLQVGADWVKGSAIKQQLKRSHKGEDVETALGLLVEGGKLERTEIKPATGRPSICYRRL